MKSKRKRKVLNLYRDSMHDIRVFSILKASVLTRKIRIDERILHIDRQRENELRKKLLEISAANEERIQKIKRLREAHRMQRLRELERRRLAQKRREELRRARAVDLISDSRYHSLESIRKNEEELEKLRNMQRMRRRLTEIQMKKNLRSQKLKSLSREMRNIRRTLHEASSALLAKELEQLRDQQEHKQHLAMRKESVRRLKSIISVTKSIRPWATRRSTRISSEPVKKTRKKKVARKLRKKRKRRKRPKKPEADIEETDDDRRRLKKKVKKKLKKRKKRVKSIEYHTVDYVAERENVPPGKTSRPKSFRLRTATRSGSKLKSVPLETATRSGSKLVQGRRRSRRSRSKRRTPSDDEDIPPPPPIPQERRAPRERGARLGKMGKPERPEQAEKLEDTILQKPGVKREGEDKPGSEQMPVIETREAPSVRRRTFRRKRGMLKGTTSEDSGLPRSSKSTIRRRRKLRGRVGKAKEPESEDSGVVRRKKSLSRRRRAERTTDQSEGMPLEDAGLPGTGAAPSSPRRSLRRRRKESEAESMISDTRAKQADSTYAKEGEEAAMQKKKKEKPIPRPKRHKRVKHQSIDSVETQMFPERLRDASKIISHEIQTFHQRLKAEPKGTRLRRSTDSSLKKQKFRRISKGPEDTLGEHPRLLARRPRGKLKKEAGATGVEGEGISRFDASLVSDATTKGESVSSRAAEVGTVAGLMGLTGLDEAMGSLTKEELEKLQSLQISSLEHIEKRDVGKPRAKTHMEDVAATETAEAVLEGATADQIVGQLREGAQRLPTMIGKMMEGMTTHRTLEGDFMKQVSKLPPGSKKLPTLMDRMMESVRIQRSMELDVTKPVTKLPPGARAPPPGTISSPDDISSPPPESTKPASAAPPPAAPAPPTKHEVMLSIEELVARSQKGKKGKKWTKEQIATSNEQLWRELQKIPKYKPPAEGENAGKKIKRRSPREDEALVIERLSLPHTLSHEVHDAKSGKRKRKTKGGSFAVERLPDTAEMRAIAEASAAAFITTEAPPKTVGVDAKGTMTRTTLDSMHERKDSRLDSIFSDVIEMPEPLQAISSPPPPTAAHLIDVLEDVQRMKRIRAETLKKYTSKDRVDSDRAKVPTVAGKGAYGRISVKDPQSVSSDVFASPSRKITRSRMKAFKKGMGSPRPSWLRDSISISSLDAWNQALQDLIKKSHPSLIQIPTPPLSQRSSEIIREQKKLGILSIFTLFEPCKEDKRKEFNPFNNTILNTTNCLEKLADFQQTGLRPSTSTGDLPSVSSKTSSMWSFLIEPIAKVA